MCFNDKTSIVTFLIGTGFSIILMNYGNIKYKKDNIVFGIFFIFISLIQFMDFLFWIDLQNKLGINYIVTLLGPLLNVGQPLILYVIKLLNFSIGKKINKIDIFIALLNCLYLFYLIKMYSTFISKGKKITSVKYNHLNWPWLKYSNKSYYLFMLTINIFYLSNFTYSFIVFLVTYFFLYLSIIYFSYRIGELWCFFGSFIPIIMFILSYFI
jgi:hypothetical protein